MPDPSCLGDSRAVVQENDRCRSGPDAINGRAASSLAIRELHINRAAFGAAKGLATKPQLIGAA